MCEVSESNLQSNSADTFVGRGPCSPEEHPGLPMGPESPCLAPVDGKGHTSREDMSPLITQYPSLLLAAGHEGMSAVNHALAVSFHGIPRIIYNTLVIPY